MSKIEDSEVFVDIETNVLNTTDNKSSVSFSNNMFKDDIIVSDKTMKDFIEDLLTLKNKYNSIIENTPQEEMIIDFAKDLLSLPLGLKTTQTLNELNVENLDALTDFNLKRTYTVLHLLNETYTQKGKDFVNSLKVGNSLLIDVLKTEFNNRSLELIDNKFVQFQSEKFEFSSNNKVSGSVNDLREKFTIQSDNKNNKKPD